MLWMGRGGGPGGTSRCDGGGGGDRLGENEGGSSVEVAVEDKGGMMVQTHVRFIDYLCATNKKYRLQRH